MAAQFDCEDVMRKWLNRGMTEEECLMLQKQAKKLKSKALAGKKAADAREEVIKEARDWNRRQQLALIAKKRAIQLQLEKRFNLVRSCLDNFKGMEAEGIAATIAGSKYARSGARMSVDALKGALEARYAAMLIHNIKKLGDEHYGHFVKHTLDREIAKAMWTIDNPNAQPFTGPRQAMDIARVIHAVQEKTRMDQNSAGAWIGKMTGYIARQSHDWGKLSTIPRAERQKYAAQLKGLHGAERKNAEAAIARDLWVKDIYARLDWEATGDGLLTDEAERLDFLCHAWDDIIHGKTSSPQPGDPLVKNSVLGSTAAHASKERVLHFKSGEAWFDYNEKYGRGHLGDAIFAGLESAARNVALMRVLGPSPHANIENVCRDLQRVFKARNDIAAQRRLEKNIKNVIPHLMKEVDGTIDMPGNPTAAAANRNARALISMSRLGGALISSLTDSACFASEMAYQGKGFFHSFVRGFSEMLKGRGTAEQLRICGLCGVATDHMSAGIISRFTGEELPGKMTAAMNLFFRANGLSWWTDAWKKSACLMLSHDLALSRNLDWKGLSREMRRTLDLYNLDAGTWDLLRQGKAIANDGRDYLTPEAAYDAPEALVEAYMRQKGMLVSKARVAQFREDLADRLRSYFRDRVQYAVLEPDARSRAFLRRGTSAGTLSGEALRYFAQFKSFPTVFIQRTLGRETFGRGNETFWSEAISRAALPMLKSRTGEHSNFWLVFLSMTALGFVAMNAKAIIAGKTPRHLDDPRAWMAAAAQGGGLGIFGDFLFGEGQSTRMGTGPISAIMGPAASTLETGLNIFSDLKAGRDVLPKTFRAFYSMLPGNNLFWVSPAMNYLVLQNAYEHMSPGYLNRMKRRIKKENDQEFWLEPLRY